MPDRSLIVLVLAATLATGGAPLPAQAAARTPAAVDDRSARLSSALATRLDLRLLPFALGEAGETAGVWVEFADKGETDAGDLAARLADAEASLSPRARARRIKNHVTPLVDYRDLPVHAPYLDALAARGFAVRGVSRWFNQAAVTVTQGQLETLAGLAAVARITPIERMRHSIDLSANDESTPAERSQGGARTRDATQTAKPCLPVDYGLTTSAIQQMNLAALHDSGYTAAGVLIAVLDAGFNRFDRQESMQHLAIPLDHQRDFVRAVWGVQDTTDLGLRHGTWVLGCMAGRKFGTYVGSAFDATYALARTENEIGEVPQEMVNWGLGAEWADSLGADLINSSLGYFTFDDPHQDYTYASMNGHTTIVTQAAQIAASKGILVVTAVGNEGSSGWHWLIAPSDANGDSVLAIGAVDSTGVVGGFSSYGPSFDGRTKPDLAARGVLARLVGGTANPQGYTTLNGTSFATPFAAGAAACLMSGRPDWTARDVALALRITASKAANPDSRMGYGIVNAFAALGYDPVTGVVSPPTQAARLRLVGAHPARLSTGISFHVSPAVADERGVAGRLRIFDAGGRLVRDLWSGTLCCSGVSVVWDGRNENGEAVASGLFFASFEAAGRRTTTRIAALR